jgi:hypothetical protein
MKYLEDVLLAPVISESLTIEFQNQIHTLFL